MSLRKRAPKSRIRNYSMKVYHGTGVSFDRPDLDHCNAVSDFGKGFYVTPDPSYAWRHANNRMRGDGDGRFWINEYTFDDELARRELVIKEFDDMESWARFVVENRLLINDEHYDIAIGPSADDAFDAVVDDYRYLYESGKEELIDWSDVSERFKSHLASEQIAFITEDSLREDFLRYGHHVEQHVRPDIGLGFDYSSVRRIPWDERRRSPYDVR